MQKGITNDPRAALSGLIAPALLGVLVIGGRVVRGSLEPRERP